MPSNVILCVDDEPSVLGVLRGLLKNLGSDLVVEVAESGQEALEICSELLEEEREVCLVISDYIMPNMRGDEFLAHLHKLSPDTTTILLTGQSDLDGIRRAINEANLYRFLEKPWDDADLILTVKSAMLTYSQARELEKRNKELEQTNASLRESERLLEGRVNERTAELSETIDRLKQTQASLVQAEKLAAMGSMVAGLSHELNTPIGITLTTASALEYSTKEVLRSISNGEMRKSTITQFLDRTMEMAGLLVRSTERAAELISTFKQVAVKQTSEMRAVFDLKDMVEQLMEILAPISGMPLGS